MNNEEQFIWFEGLEDVEHHEVMRTHWSDAYVGQQKNRLEPEEFYLEVGRPDLAEEYKSRWRLTLAAAIMYGAGALGAIGGYRRGRPTSSGGWWAGIELDQLAHHSSFLSTTAVGTKAWGRETLGGARSTGRPHA